MSVLTVLIDGAGGADYAWLPHLQKANFCGYRNHTPPARETDSLTCILNMLGVAVGHIPHGRAYLEALAVGKAIANEDVVFRCNGVSIENGKLAAACYTREFSALGVGFEFVSLGGYKNLLIAKQARPYFASIITNPPHEHVGEAIAAILPQVANTTLQRLLRAMVFEQQLFPWGQAVKTDFPQFEKLHGIKGAIVCQTEIVKGIAKALGMFCPQLQNTTADTDTNLQEKAKTSLQLLEKYPFVMLHINGVDESAHRKNRAEKNAFLQHIDEEVLQPISTNLPPHAACIVTSDHKTDDVTGKHVNCAVEQYVFNRNEECEQWLKQL